MGPGEPSRGPVKAVIALLRLKHPDIFLFVVGQGTVKHIAKILLEQWLFPQENIIPLGGPSFM